MKKISGLSFIMVLIFLQVFIVLSLCSLQITQIALKQCYHNWYHHKVCNQAREALALAENNLTHSVSSCLMPVTRTAEMAAKPLDWWQSSSCAGNFQSFQYYYVVENLGPDPCARIPIGSQTLAANYFRITLLGITENTKQMLQSTVVLPSEGKLNCEGMSHMVTIGQQMWRKIL